MGFLISDHLEMKYFVQGQASGLQGLRPGGAGAEI